MKIVAIDDSKPALKALVSAIEAAQPSDEVHGFSLPSELLAFVRENDCHIGFLDIEMWGMSGLELAAELKKIKPTINIIFVTAYSKYCQDALKLHVSGYVMKPATKEALEREIENLRFPIDRKEGARVYVQTFGNFEVFVYGKPVKFSSARAKEIFAFLVDRQGAVIKTSELTAVLFEDEPFDNNISTKTRQAVGILKKTLAENGIQDVLIKDWNSLSIDASRIICDMYDFWKLGGMAVNAYRGEYMANYSWAEFTAAALSQEAQK